VEVKENHIHKLAMEKYLFILSAYGIHGKLLKRKKVKRNVLSQA
jgi:hypothetical protein